MKTVRLTLESSDGSRCCTAVSSALPERRLVLNPLPVGDVSVTLAGFPTDFAPADGITARCVTDPVDVGQPCDPSQFAATSYRSDPKRVTIESGIVTEAGEIPVYSTPFWLDFAPPPNGSASNPVTVGFAVVDAAEEIDTDSIAIEAAGVLVAAADRQVCDDHDGTSRPCSGGRLLEVKGYVVAGEPQILSGSPILVRVGAHNAGGHSQDFRYPFALVPGTPTVTPSEPPAPTDTPVSTTTPTDTPSVTPTHSPTPAPSLTATAVPSSKPSATQSQTPTVTATQTNTATQLATVTSTQTLTATRTPTDTPTATVTATPTPSATQTATTTPTQTATTTQTATETPTLTPSVVTLRVSSAAGAAGTTVSFAVTLSTAGRQVLGVQHQLAAEPANAGIRIAARVDALGAQVPDCTAGTSVLVQVSFRPTGCSPDTSCSGLMATVLSTRDPIADGATLYTCKAAIASTAAPGTTAHLRCSNAQFVQPDEQVGPAACTDGAVVATGAP